jgi:hypothetical protein
MGVIATQPSVPLPVASKALLTTPAIPLHHRDNLLRGVGSGHGPSWLGWLALANLGFYLQFGKSILAIQ